MVAPMISCLAAYMMVTGKIIPWWHMVTWMTLVSLIGVLLAFPKGRASGLVLDALHTGSANTGKEFD